MMRSLTLIGFFAISILFPFVVLASPPAEIWVYCGDLPGCSPGYREYISSVMQLLASHIFVYAYAIGVLAVMVGGAYMILAAGRDDWVTKGKNTITWACIGLAAISFADEIVQYIRLEALSRLPGADFVLSVNKTLISSIFDLLNVSLFGVCLYLGMKLVVSNGKDDEFSKAKMGLFYAALGAVTINLAQQVVDAFTT